MKNPLLWKPRASLAVLRHRAILNRHVRAFFADRQVLEVETPVLSKAGTVDPHIDSFAVTGGHWLQTSPEFAMKRLLAAGSGPIFQIAHVFRIDEAGRHHNPEFSMLEWYRPGWNHLTLMGEVEALIRMLKPALPTPLSRITYREAFQLHAAIDPFAATVQQLQQRCLDAGIDVEAPACDAVALRDFHLDLLMGAVVGPALGIHAPEFLYDFPASQSALARIRRDDPPVAERFELFWRGIELANGFHELRDAREQRERFESDTTRRQQRGQATPAYDTHLIDALESGLPDCAGVAIGLDRLLMLLLGLDDLRDTLAFDWERA
jgi:lysyl-tRNA synthetase class 2